MNEWLIFAAICFSGAIICLVGLAVELVIDLFHYMKALLQ